MQAHPSYFLSYIQNLITKRPLILSLSKGAGGRSWAICVVHGILSSCLLNLHPLDTGAHNTGASQGHQEQGITITLPDGTSIDIKNKQDITGIHTAESTATIPQEPIDLTPEAPPSSIHSPAVDGPFAANSFDMRDTRNRLQSYLPRTSYVLMGIASAWIALRIWHTGTYWYLNHPRRAYAWCKTLTMQPYQTGQAVAATPTALLKMHLTQRYPDVPSLAQAIGLCMGELEQEERQLNRIASYLSCAHACHVLAGLPILKQIVQTALPASPELQAVVDQARHAILYTRSCLKELLAQPTP